METDPNDGKICFNLIEIGDFQIRELRDVIDFWQAVYRIGNILLKDNGYVIYPVVLAEDLRKNGSA